MNGTQLKYGHLLPGNNDQKFAVDGIVICCNCGSEETTVLSFGIYCRACRSFRLFRKMTRRSYELTGTVLDLD